jgi:predicted ATPase
MLLDLLFDGVRIKNKRRMHFHSFMKNVRERMHDAGQELRNDLDQHPLTLLIRALAKEHVANLFEYCVH